jgi:hypothetical protein
MESYFFEGKVGGNKGGQRRVGLEAARAASKQTQAKNNIRQYNLKSKSTIVDSFRRCGSCQKWKK